MTIDEVIERIEALEQRVESIEKNIDSQDLGIQLNYLRDCVSSLETRVQEMQRNQS